MSLALDLPSGLKQAAHRRAGNATAWSFTGIAGPLLIEVRRFADARGAFAETYSHRDFADLGIDWPVAPRDAVLSNKDARLPRLADLPPIFA